MSKSHAASIGRCCLPSSPGSEQTHSMAKGWVARAGWLKRCCCGTCKPPRRAGSSQVSQVGTGSLGRCSTKGSHLESHGPSSLCGSDWAGWCCRLSGSVLAWGMLPWGLCFLLPPSSSRWAGLTFTSPVQAGLLVVLPQAAMPPARPGYTASVVQEALLSPGMGSMGQVVGKKAAVGLGEGYPVSSALPVVLACLHLGQCRDRVRPT